MADKIAYSNLVYFTGSQTQTSTDGDCCTFGVLKYKEQLPQVQDPQEFDVMFITSGTDGGIDIAIYYNNGGWVVYPLKGMRGLRGHDGKRGEDGLTGKKGDDGLNGGDGQPGLPPAHQLDGTRIRFKNPNGTWGNYMDLKGDAGKDGKDGKNGIRGAKPDHKWVDTRLSFEKPDNTWGAEVDLKGEEGLAGDKGDTPAHGWNPLKPTELRFELPSGLWGSYQDLQGTKGNDGGKGEDGKDGQDGLPPQHEVLEDKVRFRNPDGTWGEFATVVVTKLGLVSPPPNYEWTDWAILDDSGKIQGIIEMLNELDARVITLET